MGALRSIAPDRRELRCFGMIFLCFTLTSAVWLSWVYHLTDLVGATTVDLVSMGAGYLLQAAGLALFVLGERRRSPLLGRGGYRAVLLLFLLCAVPALRSGFAAGALVFGLLMGLLIGLIAGWYLRSLTLAVRKERRGLVFGGGYALSTVTVWLLSRFGIGSFLKSGAVLFVYLALTALCLFLPPVEAEREAREEEPAAGEKTEVRGCLLLLCATVFLLSLTKNVGFSFPSADLAAGLDLELSRVLYAVGLIAAGLISDRSRRYGAVCALTALVTPFIMLALSGETVSAAIFWGLDYLLFGFFSVFRVLLFADLAEHRNAPALSGLGLFCGRLGDAAGSVLSTLLAGRLAVAVLVTTGLFTVTVFVFFRFFQQQYADAAPARERSGEERFEAFASRCALSSRERAVLRLVLEERTNSEIAQTLFVTESTVKFHMHNLLKKTGCRNRLELLAAYSSET